MSAQEIISRLTVLAILVSITVTIHGVATLAAIHYASRRMTVVIERPYFFSRVISILFFVIVLLAAHLIEMVCWAVTIYGLGLASDLPTAYLFAMETYTTLGYREAVLPASWRPLAGWLATTGILMFAWSTAILTNFINRLTATVGMLD